MSKSNLFAGMILTIPKLSGADAFESRGICEAFEHRRVHFRFEIPKCAIDSFPECSIFGVDILRWKWWALLHLSLVSDEFSGQTPEYNSVLIMQLPENETQHYLLFIIDNVTVKEVVTITKVRNLLDNLDLLSRCLAISAPCVSCIQKSFLALVLYLHCPQFFVSFPVFSEGFHVVSFYVISNRPSISNFHTFVFIFSGSPATLIYSSFYNI